MDGNKPALALYERAQKAIPTSPESDRPLAHIGYASLIAHAARQLNYRIV